MRQNIVAYVLAALMIAASIAAVALRPSAKIADRRPAIVLEAMIPKKFGDWREESQRLVQVVNPQTQALLDRLYSQILTRTYVNDDGYRVMLSIAYGTDQRGSLQAHKPEVCYPAQGFKLHATRSVPLATQFGEIPAQRLFTSLGQRKEPVTYWFTVGDKAVQGKFQRRIAELTYGLTGRIPDGLLFRVSSIDGDQARAQHEHDDFVQQLLPALSPGDRARISGLSGDV